MINSVATVGNNLKTAGYLLLLEIVCGVAISMVLERNGSSSNLILPAVWLFNLAPAWHLSKAATDLGKNKWFYGLIAVFGPPLAIFAFAMLSLHTSVYRLNHGVLSTMDNSTSTKSRMVAPWIYTVVSGYMFGAITSAFLAFLGTTNFSNDHRSEHFAFSSVFLGIFCLLTGFIAYSGLSKRQVHPAKFIVVFVLGAIFAIALLTWLYTRHVG